MSDSKFIKKTSSQRRVVITGLGLVSPLGNTLDASWNSLINGKSGIDKITHFDTANYNVKIAGEVKNFDVSQYVEKKEQKKMARFIHLAVGAAEMAFKDSGITITEELSTRAACIIGVGLGGLPEIENQTLNAAQKGPKRVSPFYIPQVISNLASGNIAIKYNLKGPNYSTTSACASGNHAIGDAYRYIRDGLCDFAITGGSESTVCPTAMAGFTNMKALSTRNDSPSEASRPWDTDRDGFVLGEGSGVLILEDYESALKRGAKIYAEITGFGFSSDAYHITSPSLEGDGAALAMTNCLKDAGVNPEQIDYVNAHGTSTPLGDLGETKAIKKAFGEHSKNLWISSTKSMTGHLLGAAGAVESIISIMAIHNKIVPPTINLASPGEGCNLDYVPHTAREKEITSVLNNSFGFGGTNACLSFSKI